MTSEKPPFVAAPPRARDAVGGEHDPGAVVLVPLPAALAGAAGPDEVAHAHRVAGLEPRDAAADAGDHADDLVPARADRRGDQRPLLESVTLLLLALIKFCSAPFATSGGELDYPGTTGYMALPQ